MSQNFDETQHPRDPKGQFASKGPAPESETTLGPPLHDADAIIEHYGSANDAMDWVNSSNVQLEREVHDELERRAALRGAPFNATVQPQYWRGDYAVDAGEPEEFDISGSLHHLDPHDRENLVEEAESGTLGYEGDELYFEAVERGDATGGYGPFSVSVDQTDLREWLTENQPWEEDGTTPHPTGGYVAIQAEDGRTVTYLDAEGRPHNNDGPAQITFSADGQHREDVWMQHGEMHREGGPARTNSADGSEAWARFGQPHRTDGPAVSHPRAGLEEYWVEGEKIGERVSNGYMAKGWKLVDGRPVKE